MKTRRAWRAALANLPAPAPGIVEPTCAYREEHRAFGHDWCRVPSRASYTWERVALCGICRPNPFVPRLNA